MIDQAFQRAKQPRAAPSGTVRIMEIDVDDVPWKDELVDAPRVVRDGHPLVPTRPGWGAELNEAVARKHLWGPGRLPGYSEPAMYRR